MKLNGIVGGSPVRRKHLPPPQPPIGPAAAQAHMARILARGAARRAAQGAASARERERWLLALACVKPGFSSRHVYAALTAADICHHEKARSRMAIRLVAAGWTAADVIEIARNSAASLDVLNPPAYSWGLMNRVLRAGDSPRTLRLARAETETAARAAALDPIAYRVGQCYWEHGQSVEWIAARFNLSETEVRQIAGDPRIMAKQRNRMQGSRIVYAEV